MSVKKTDSKKYKWRSKTFGAAALVSIVALAIALSFIAQQLETKYGLRADLSFNKITTLSDETAALLSNLNQPVKIYAIAYRGSEDQDLKGLLDRYQSKNPNIHWQMIVPNENPSLITSYQEKGENVRENSLIIEAPQTGRYKVVDPSQYAAREYNTNLELELRYQYERMISEAILYTTSQEIPKALFTRGHGEGEEIDLLLQALISNNFEVEEADFTQEDIKGDVLFIISPVKDFTPEETEKVLTYLEGGGKLFITLDPSFNEPDGLAKMPNFTALIKAYGINPTAGIILADMDIKNTYYANNLVLMPTVTDLALNSPLIQNRLTQILLPQARGFMEPEVFDERLQVENLLLSDASAYERKMDIESINQEKQLNEAAGPFALAVLSTKQEPTGNTSKVFAIGTSLAFTDDDIMYYSDNEGFLHTVLSDLVPREGLSLNISTKAGYRPPLSQNSTTIGVGMVVILPILVLVAALFILRPRKYL